MNLQRIYNHTQEICNFLNENTERLDSFDTVVSPNRSVEFKNKVLKQIVHRCSDALKLTEDNIYFLRGVDRPIPPIQYIKPGLKKRSSRDSWSLWNILFDYSPENKEHQKRRYSLMMTNMESIADDFGKIYYVLPINNAILSTSSDDFIDMIPVGRYEYFVRGLTTPFSSKFRKFSQYILADSNSPKEIFKVINIINRVIKREDDMDFDFIGNFPRQLWYDHKEKIKSEGLLKFLFTLMSGNNDIQTHEISTFPEKKFGEIWTSAPCYILESSVFGECLKIYKEGKK